MLTIAPNISIYSPLYIQLSTFNQVKAKYTKDSSLSRGFTAVIVPNLVR